MYTSRTLEVLGKDVPPIDAPAEAPTGQPHRAPRWWRVGKLGLALAFLAAAAYFFHAQVWTATSLQGTLTSPLITIRSPIDGVVTANTTTIGAPVAQQQPLFVIEAHQLDTRLRAELQAKLAAAQQQALVIDRKIVELSALRTQLQARRQAHREATLARLEALIAETTAQLNRAKAVMARTQHEMSRATTLSAKGLIAEATLDDAVLAHQQARYEVERLTASVKRLAVERTAANNGVLVGEGYGDAPYSQQRIDELAARVIEAQADRASVQQTRQELASRLGEEQRREAALRTATVTAPVTGVVWNLHIAADGVVARHAPLADVVDCRRAFVEATVPERRYDDVELGDTVDVTLLGSRRTMPGTIHAVRGQSAVVRREGLAARLTPHRSREALTVSVVVDPEALQQVSQGVCQIGRSAKVHFARQGVGAMVRQGLASVTGVISSASAAIAPRAR